MKSKHDLSDVMTTSRHTPMLAIIISSIFILTV